MTTGRRHPATPPSPGDALTTPFVILRHEEPSGGRHFDWLVAREADPDPQARALLALRCPIPPGYPPVPLDAVRLPDHRAHYLTYEGPLSGGRGVVTRVLEGRAVLEESATALVLRLAPSGAPPLAYRAEAPAGRGGVWRLTPI